MPAPVNGFDRAKSQVLRFMSGGTRETGTVRTIKEAGEAPHTVSQLVVAQDLLHPGMKRYIDGRFARVREELAQATVVAPCPWHLLLARHDGLANVDNQLFVERFAAVERPAAEVDAGVFAARAWIVARL